MNAEQSQVIAYPVSYLYRIVRNLTLDWVRRADASTTRTADAATLDRFATATATPEQTTFHREQVRVLAEALAELPVRTRIAFEMHELEGRSLRYIANRLGISAVRAHQLVKNAIRHAAQRLNAEEQNHPSIFPPPAKRRRKAMGMMATAVAASLAIVLATVLATVVAPAVQIRIAADYVTGTGEIREIVLGDASRVHLDGASAVAVR